MTVANECSVIAIPVEHISAVCFNVSTVGSAGVTTLTNECEKRSVNFQFVYIGVYI